MPRLTTASYIVLGLVDLLGPSTPYDIKQAAANSVASFWSLPHAQVYAQCDRLIAAGMLCQHQEQSGRRRRVLTLTDAGRQALAEWKSRELVETLEVRDHGLLQLFFGAQPDQIAGPQLEAHKGRLARLENRQDEVAPDLDPGQRAMLEFGIEIERVYVRMWERMAATA